MSALTDRASMLREFFRLVNADATDADMTEHDATTLEGAYEALDVGLRRAQLYLISIGLGEDWLRSAEVSFYGTGLEEYAELPFDFLRLDSDPGEGMSGLRTASGGSWGTEVLAKDRRRVMGNRFYLRGIPRQEVADPGIKDPSLWDTSGGEWTVVDGKAVSVLSDPLTVPTNASFVEDAVYRYEVRVSAVSASVLYLQLGSVFTQPNFSSVGIHVGEAAWGSGATLRLASASAGATVTGVSLRRVGGSFGGDYGLWLTKGAAPPSGLYADYYYRLPALEDDVDVAIRPDDRNLVPAYAAEYAMRQAWFAGGMEQKQAVVENLLAVQGESYRRGRPTRQPRKVSVAPAMGRWMI